MKRLAQRTTLNEVVNLLPDGGQCTALGTVTNGLVKVGFGCVVRTTRVCAMVGGNSVELSPALSTELCTGISDVGSTYWTMGHDGTPPSYMASAAATAGTLSIGGSGRKDKGVRGMEQDHVFEPGLPEFTIRRDGFERAMRCLLVAVRGMRYARSEITGLITFEKTDVALEGLASMLLQDKKCRVVMDYDPAEDKVYFVREESS